MNNIFNTIQYSDKNRELFGSFIAKTASPIKAVSVDPVAVDRYTWSTYKDHLKNKKSNEFKFTLGGGIAGVFLAGLLLLAGRKGAFKKMNQYFGEVKNNLQEKINSGNYSTVTKISRNIASGLEKTAKSLFIFDKTKDGTLMLALNRLGAPGKWLVKLSQSTLGITAKVAKGFKVVKDFGGYKGTKRTLTNISSYVDDALKKTSNKEEKALLERAKALLAGNHDTKGLSGFMDDLVNGFDDRATIIQKEIQKRHVNQFLNTYLPKGKDVLKLRKWEKIANKWKNLFAGKKNIDALRGDKWVETYEELVKNVNKTGLDKSGRDFGKAREELKILIKEIDGFKTHNESIKVLSEKLKVAQNGIKKAVDFETGGIKGETGYAGRAVDLLAGGGITELFLPPALAAGVTYHTVKDAKPGERQEKFIESGGAALVGGLASWAIISNIFAIGGFPGMAIGLGVGFITDKIGKMYLEFKQKNK